MNNRWERSLRRLVTGLVCIALLYGVDWAALEIRVAHGTAFRVVQVNEFLATPLKGQKEEYDMIGTFPQTCSRSVFPQKGNLPCWWLVRHASQWE